jgi:hypothetical protein
MVFSLRKRTGILTYAAVCTNFEDILSEISQSPKCTRFIETERMLIARDWEQDGREWGVSV